MELDILIRGGTVIDGTGGDRFRADVAISDGRIEAIGPLEGAVAARTIDASGHVVTPGFIDMHSHSDVTLLDDPGGESKVHQGVTIEVTGNCSYTPYPSGVAGPKGLQEGMGTTMSSVVEWDWETLDEWAARVYDNGVSINIAPQLGQGALRVAAGAVQARPATEDQMRAMKRLAAEAMEQGAFSMSTALNLSPSSYAPTEEVIELCRTVAQYDNAFYVTHARTGAGRFVSMIEEAVAIGHGAEIPVQFSHISITDSRSFGIGPEMVGVIERARAGGLDITYDVYPYTAAGIDLNQLIPLWTQEGGTEAFMARLADPDLHGRALQEMRDGVDGKLQSEWGKIVIAFSGSEANQDKVGRSVEDISESTGVEPAELVLRLIEEERDIIGAVIHNRIESDIRFFLGQSTAMYGSDGNAISPTGSYGKTQPHPRFYGTYPRILGRYVREQPAVLTLEDAIHKMSGFPAQRLGLRERGLLKKGLIADLVVLDPETVIDNATFDDPHQYPGGIPHVLVAGEPVVLNGKHTGARPGRVLRRGAA